jgi:hypothetical protein
MYATIVAWSTTGVRAKVNFNIREAGERVWCKDDLIKAWSALTVDEMTLDILSAEDLIAMRRKHTSRDLYVAKMGRKVLQYVKDHRTATETFVEFADRPDVLALEDFDCLDAVQCKTFDVVTGELVQYPLASWFNDNHWRTHTLVLHGDAGLGKTPLAMTLLTMITNKLQSDRAWKPYYIKVGTVEGLRDASSSNLMRSLVPILFDDISPDRACGTRRGMPLDDVKLLCEVTQSSTVHARCKDISFATDQPRMFTSNALNPYDWHDGLPAGVFNVTPAQRLSYSPNVKAAFKRIAFAFVPCSLVPAAVRTQHQQARLGGGASSSGL